MSIPTVSVQRTIKSPTVTPQALAWDGKQLWVSSRDLGFFYKLNSDVSNIAEEVPLSFPSPSNTIRPRLAVGLGASEIVVVPDNWNA